MLHILVVDDEHMVLQVASRALEEQGFQVTSATDGLEAWELLQDVARPVHAVVTDIRMPRMGGLALAELVRTLPSPPPILFISGYGQHDLASVYPFLPKPFHPDQLATMVVGLLEGVCREHSPAG